MQSGSVFTLSYNLGDKDELLDDGETNHKQTMAHSDSNSSGGHSEMASLKNPKKVLEAGKAV